MNIEDFREFCLSFPLTTEELPFDDHTLVFKVAGKMFAATSLVAFDRVNLKCDPERAIDLREKHDAIIPGYHMNKKHWNSLMMDGSIGNSLFKELISHSYELVVAGLPKKVRDEIRNDFE